MALKSRIGPVITTPGGYRSTSNAGYKLSPVTLIIEAGLPSGRGDGISRMQFNPEEAQLRCLGDDEADHVRRDARAFCLATIRETYGIDYHRDWHADLDSLVLADGKDWYSASSRGMFCVVQTRDGGIIATGGLHGFSRKPATAIRLRTRYEDQDTVCQIVRVYLALSVRVSTGAILPISAV